MDLAGTPVIVYDGIMIILNLDRKSATPIFRQIIRNIQDLFEKKVITPGYRMPSTRILAESLDVSRSTVIKAYEELWALGYLDSRPGSYSIVRKRTGPAAKKTSPGNGLIDWEEISAPASREIHQSNQGFWSLSRQGQLPDTIKMSGLSLDVNHFPADRFRKCLNRVLIEKMADIYNFGDPQGYLPLREFISRRMQIHGITVSPDEILITNGTQSSINLILKLLAREGEDVVVENPTYFLLPPVLKFHKLNPVGVPVHPEGMDIKMLEQVLGEKNPLFLYTIPNFQNPTGITAEPSHREAVLSLCEKYRCPILEDAFEEEMRYFGKVPLPIKAMDSRKIVIYMSSFSKVLFPGIRIGWIAAERECIKRLISLKVFSDISSNLPVQAALAEFGKEGYYDLHIKRIHRIYRKRMTLALRTMKRHLPYQQVSWVEPSGGFIIWITLKDTGRTDEQLHRLLLEHGVRVFPGEYSFVSHSDHNHFRMSISNMSEEDMVEGIRRIGRALSTIYQ